MANSLKKVLIIAYFGKLPNYFSYWLKSASFNTTFDFLIFSDDSTQYNYPSNVKFFEISFTEMLIMIKKKIDLKIDISPYKLCDLKPCYGDIFEEYIQGYDYWGYCDIDLIFGNLEKAYNDELLINYDKISDAGHFTLIKNNLFFRTAYKNLKSYACYDFQDVISSNKSFAFDEWGANKGINRILLENGFKLFYHPILFADICVEKYGLITTRIRYGPEKDVFIERKKHNICYSFENGTLIQHYLDENNKYKIHEESYIHLQKRPMVIKTDGLDYFIIYPPNKIINFAKIDADSLLKIHEHRLYFHYISLRFKAIKKRIKRFYCK